MFENLSDKIDRAFKILKGQGKITEVNVSETLKEIRKALLDADVNFKVAKAFTESVKEIQQLLFLFVRMILEVLQVVVVLEVQEAQMQLVLVEQLQQLEELAVQEEGEQMMMVLTEVALVPH